MPDSLAEQIEALAAKYESSPKQPHNKTSDPFRAKPGTRLLRQWQGETHHCTVLESSFGYQGQQYRSLSEIARLITGTRWSGPLFFGLKQKQQRGKPR